MSSISWGFGRFWCLTASDLYLFWNINSNSDSCLKTKTNLQVFKKSLKQQSIQYYKSQGTLNDIVKKFNRKEKRNSHPNTNNSTIAQTFILSFTKPNAKYLR